MVALSTVQASNALLKTLPHPVAIFVGATSGIGKSTLLHYVQYTSCPRIYFIGRSQSAADAILSEFNEINPDGSYAFIQADVSLLNTVDGVCKTIREKEEKIDLLFMSQGILDFKSKTSEQLPLMRALSYYSRMRFIANLLPLLEASSGRVISVMMGTKEGFINPSDIRGEKLSFWNARGHHSSMMTLTMERFAEMAPTVSFIHNYPGFVETPFGKKMMQGVTGIFIKVLYAIGMLFITREDIPIDESGQRHVYMATSDAFSVQKPFKTTDASAESDGNGVFSLGAYCDPDERVQTVLDILRQDGIKERVWLHLQEEFKRIDDMI
ncbi:hypothetical protein ASPZODRAFT_142624 [Penicilliopsis zonata CBS 506.65]|uniref:Ketoreductase (KR) domain-containing protein n=1 Tax=Penicilliopsis zonata CBS 506.65 TaxID=1073090 RepID=A0A1L9SFX9_9EURO|nr:hypothetical protein ASPZODRAFT_142624 [Penicilliopsis zonata CBS 506.65]OJJ45987.1 hypothetical protein ASPZODRAFT_142624 [Penicilliopsis zonata CBS 506.65]